MGEPPVLRREVGARTGRADVIVTGDQDLLTLGGVDQIEILTARQFLEALQRGA
jgi:predicted nucleic acid-binding protein